MLAEMDAAEARIDRQDDMALTVAWLTASLQRAAKIPKLAKLLARPKGKGKAKSKSALERHQDLVMFLGDAKTTLPKITMADLRARVRSDGMTE